MSKTKALLANPLTLELPLLILDNNEPWDKGNYEMDGIYFVKTKDGLIHLVDVNIADSNNFVSNLPANVINHLIEQHCAFAITENIKQMFNEHLERMSFRMDEAEKQVSAISNQVDKCLKYNREAILEKLELLVEALKKSPTEVSAKPIQGHISESALVEILRTIK
jgi:hypothetical protein